MCILILGTMAVGCTERNLEAEAALDAPARVQVQALAPEGDVTLRVEGGAGNAPPDVILQIRKASGQPRSGGTRATLESLDLPLGDIDVPPEALPPDGIKLRQVRLHVDQPTRAKVMHAQPDALEIRASLPFTL